MTTDVPIYGFQGSIDLLDQSGEKISVRILMENNREFYIKTVTH